MTPRASDERAYLEAIAEAASDYELAERAPEFAKLNGGVDALKATLFERVIAWESYVYENVPETNHG